MHVQFLYKLFKTKLAIKIWFYLTLIVLFFLLIIGLLMELFLRNYVEKNELNNAIRNNSHCATAFSSEYDNLLENFVTYTASSDFYDLLVDIQNSSTNEYIQNNTNIQKYLTQYSNISTLVAGSMITTKENRVFHSYKFQLVDNNPPYTLTYDFQDASRITIFPSSESPFQKQGNVIPVTFLLSVSSSNKLTLLADSIEDTDVILYLFLSTSKVNNFLSLYYNNDAHGLLYLADSSGTPISLSTSDGNNYITATDGALQTAISKQIESGATTQKWNQHYLIIDQVENTDLYLINYIPRTTLIAPLRQLDLFLIFLFALTILFIPLFGFLVSIFVTKPLKELIGTVKKIETNTYITPSVISKDDEIGQLGKAFDSMQQTIQTQFRLIKKEEHENFQMEIRLLSEQINPHFLYNTLECINMEIYNHHNDTASNMIASLGEYLRISLSYGKNQIKLQTELEQVKAYINIMNYRFQHHVQLTLDIDPSLSNMLILKSILQPFVENSIKHGFSIDNTNCFSIAPQIEISVSRIDQELLLKITDNGAGIDIEKATAIMKRSGSEKDQMLHVGLHNVYNRLRSFYETSDVTFSSIPYYQNQITIHIPWSGFIQSQVMINT